MRTRRREGEGCDDNKVKGGLGWTGEVRAGACRKQTSR